MPALIKDFAGVLPVVVVSPDGLARRIAFYDTSDGGLTWTFQTTVNIEPPTGQFIPSPVDDRFLALGPAQAHGDPRIVDIALGGRHTLTTSRGLRGGDVLQLEVIEEVDGWAILSVAGCHGAEVLRPAPRCFSSAGLFTTHDGGERWRQVTLPD
jgi:hypothetical protein